MYQLNDYIEYIDHNYLIPTKDIKNLDDLIDHFLNYCDNMEYDIFYTEKIIQKIKDLLNGQDLLNVFILIHFQNDKYDLSYLYNNHYDLIDQMIQLCQSEENDKQYSELFGISQGNAILDDDLFLQNLSII
jgi:hypothetical protein